MPADLVFCEIPRKSVQGRRHTRRLRRPFLGMTTLKAIARCVIRVLRAPARLSLLPARRLALWLSARMLAVSHSRVRTEPAAANRAWSLPDGEHRDSSSPLPRAAPARRSPSDALGHFWRVEVGHFSQAPKAPDFALARGEYFSPIQARKPMAARISHIHPHFLA